MKLIKISKKEQKEEFHESSFKLIKWKDTDRFISYLKSIFNSNKIKKYQETNLSMVKFDGDLANKIVLPQSFHVKEQEFTETITNIVAIWQDLINSNYNSSISKKVFFVWLTNYLNKVVITPKVDWLWNENESVEMFSNIKYLSWESNYTIDGPFLIMNSIGGSSWNIEDDIPVLLKPNITTEGTIYERKVYWVVKDIGNYTPYLKIDRSTNKMKAILDLVKQCTNGKKKIVATHIYQHKGIAHVHVFEDVIIEDLPIALRTIDLVQLLDAITYGYKGQIPSGFYLDAYYPFTVINRYIMALTIYLELYKVKLPYTVFTSLTHLGKDRIKHLIDFLNAWLVSGICKTIMDYIANDIICIPVGFKTYTSPLCWDIKFKTVEIDLPIPSEWLTLDDIGQNTFYWIEPTKATTDFRVYPHEYRRYSQGIINLYDFKTQIWCLKTKNEREETLLADYGDIRDIYGYNQYSRGVMKIMEAMINKTPKDGLLYSIGDGTGAQVKWLSDNYKYKIGMMVTLPEEGAGKLCPKSFKLVLMDAFNKEPETCDFFHSDISGEGGAEKWNFDKLIYDCVMKIRNDGCMLVKWKIHKNNLITLLAIINEFSHTEIIKPKSSRFGNTEVYIWGEGKGQKQNYTIKNLWYVINQYNDYRISIGTKVGPKPYYFNMRVQTPPSEDDFKNFSKNIFASRPLVCEVDYNEVNNALATLQGMSSKVIIEPLDNKKVLVYCSMIKPGYLIQYKNTQTKINILNLRKSKYIIEEGKPIEWGPTDHNFIPTLMKIAICSEFEAKDVVLDIGCGEGFYHRWALSRWITIDLHKKADYIGDAFSILTSIKLEEVNKVCIIQANKCFKGISKDRILGAIKQCCPNCTSVFISDWDRKALENTGIEISAIDSSFIDNGYQDYCLDMEGDKIDYMNYWDIGCKNGGFLLDKDSYIVNLSNLWHLYEIDVTTFKASEVKGTWVKDVEKPIIDTTIESTFNLRELNNNIVNIPNNNIVKVKIEKGKELIKDTDTVKQGNKIIKEIKEKELNKKDENVDIQINNTTDNSNSQETNKDEQQEEEDENSTDTYDNDDETDDENSQPSTSKDSQKQVNKNSIQKNNIISTTTTTSVTTPISSTSTITTTTKSFSSDDALWWDLTPNERIQYQQMLDGDYLNKITEEKHTLNLEQGDKPSYGKKDEKKKIEIETEEEEVEVIQKKKKNKNKIITESIPYPKVEEIRKQEEYKKRLIASAEIKAKQKMDEKDSEEEIEYEEKDKDPYFEENPIIPKKYVPKQNTTFKQNTIRIHNIPKHAKKQDYVKDNDDLNVIKKRKFRVIPIKTKK